MNVACDDAMLMQANEDTSSYIKNEKYYSFNNLARKSIKNAEQEAKNINRLKSLSTSSYSLKPETIKSLSLDKVSEENTESKSNNLTIDTKLKRDKSNEQISIFQMDREDSKDNSTSNSSINNKDNSKQNPTNNNSFDSNTLNKEQPKTAIESSMANLKPKLCMTPETVLRTKYDILTSFERVEIRDYEEIWYIGSSSVPKIDIAYKKPSERKHGEKPEVVNNGYDDSRGDYHIVVHDHINYRYEIISLLGKGSFGKVLKCYDHKEKNYVAVKIIKNKKKFEKQGMVEVKILDAIKSRDPENVMNSYNIKFIESFYFRGHLCIVNELLGINLYEWIKNGGFRGVNVSMIRHITKEILISLAVLEEKRIVHCDLKPENILLRDPMQIKPSLSSQDLDKIGIKVIDFGSSCYEHERVYNYVQSRFYRSPEVILGIPYNMSIDMWSLGCILAELYTGYPIFPGENEEEQLACIMEIMGAPASYIVEQSTRKKNFFDDNNSPKIIANSKGRKRRPGTLSLATVLRCRDNTFLDFITQCLQWDPKKRLTASEGLKHAFITKLTKKNSSDNTTKNISTNSMFSTFEEFKNMNNAANIKKSKSSVGTTSTSNSTVSHTSHSTGLTKAKSNSTQNIVVSKTEPKTYTGIKHTTSQFNPTLRSSLAKNNTVGGALPTGRKSSGSSLPKISSKSDDNAHSIQVRKSTGNLINYSDSSASNSGKVAKIIAAAEQKTLSTPKSYIKKDSSLAIETIKNVRRPSVKEIAFAKDNIERANALLKNGRSSSKEGVTTQKKTMSLLDTNYKFTTKAPRKNSLSINVNQLGVSSSTQSKSAYPKLSSGFFGSSSTSKEGSSDGNDSISKPRKYSLLSKSLNPSMEAVHNKNTTTEKTNIDDEIEKLDFNKIDISDNNKNQASSLKQPNVYPLKRSNSSGNMLLGTIRKTFNAQTSNSVSNVNSSNNINSTNNSKYSSSIPTSTVKLLPINNTNTNNNSIIGNNSSFSSTISSSSSSTLVNDDNYDTPSTQQSSNVNSLSILTQEVPVPVVKTRQRAYSHSVYQSSQGSSIPRLASIYKNSSNNITKTINKINNNIESHNAIGSSKEREYSTSIKTAGLVTKRKSAFSLKAKAAQAQAQATPTSTTNNQPRWKI